MANKKITELTELPVAGQNDVLPVVDLTGPETKKIKVSGLKSSLNLTRTDVGLSNVDNTSDADKPVSTATQAALDLKADAADVYTKTESDTNFEPKNSNIQAHIADLANPHQVTKAQVGLDQVDNTSDIDKPVSTATQNALNLKEDAANKGAANGYAPLVDSKVPALYLPSYVDDVVEVANFAALPNPGEVSKIYVTLDNNKTYRWSGATYIEVSPSDVNSVNGHTGIVVLTKSDIGLDQVDNTSDLDKPISTATQSALDNKLDIPAGTVEQYVAGDASLQVFPKNAVVYKAVSLLNDFDGQIYDVTNWKNTRANQIANNQHFLHNPEKYLKCKWRVNLRNDLGIYNAVDIGPFSSLSEASQEFENILQLSTNSNSHIITVTPYDIQDDLLPKLSRGFAYNNTFQKIFKKKDTTSGASKSFRINSYPVAALQAQTVPFLKTIFSNLYGFNPFPVDPSNWTEQHFGVFLKTKGKKQITKFLKSNSTVSYKDVGTSLKHYYDSSLSSFVAMNSVPSPTDFFAGITASFDGIGQYMMTENVLRGYENTNMLGSVIHAVKLQNGDKYAVFFKDYNKDRLLVYGVETTNGEEGFDPKYQIEAVVSDTLNNKKIYQLQASVNPGGEYRQCQFDLSGIYLKPKVGSTVKFRYRDPVTNKVSGHFSFMLKVVKRGPICVVDTVPNDD